MKNVYLLPDGGGHWEEIEACLRSVNAHVIRLREPFDPGRLKEAPPELFVVGEGALSDLLRHQLRTHPVIIVCGEGTAGRVAPSPTNPKTVTVNWPMTHEAFLSLSAELARLSQRRIFRTLVRLFSRDEGGAVLGRSLDFSRSGMAFRTVREFGIGAELEVSLSLPNADGSVRFPVKVMRTSPDGEEVIHGARFASLDAERRAFLEEFLAQG